MPLFCWSWLITAYLLIATTPPTQHIPQAKITYNVPMSL
jgi:hypothetical protein